MRKSTFWCFVTVSDSIEFCVCFFLCEAAKIQMKIQFLSEGNGGGFFSVCVCVLVGSPFSMSSASVKNLILQNVWLLARTRIHFLALALCHCSSFCFILQFVLLLFLMMIFFSSCCYYCCCYCRSHQPLLF